MPAAGSWSGQTMLSLIGGSVRLGLLLALLKQLLKTKSLFPCNAKIYPSAISVLNNMLKILKLHSTILINIVCSSLFLHPYYY